jgi:hypothetical protein
MTAVTTPTSAVLAHAASRLHHHHARNPPATDGPFGRCDSTSYAYCALSAALFLVGAFMFLFMYLSAAANDSTGRPSNLDDGWLVGPIFMCTGLLLGIKNLLYMRRAKLLFDLLLAQEQRADRVRIFGTSFFFFPSQHNFVHVQ